MHVTPPQGAAAEASFLRELHAARRSAAKLAAVMADVAAGCPDACGPEPPPGGYKAVAAGVAGVARRAAALRANYERANKVGGRCVRWGRGREPSVQIGVTRSFPGLGLGGCWLEADASGGAACCGWGCGHPSLDLVPSRRLAERPERLP